MEKKKEILEEQIKQALISTYKVISDQLKDDKTNNKISNIKSLDYSELKNLKNKDDFIIHQILSEPDLSSLRWTVDEPVDLELIIKIFENLYLDECYFSMNDILKFVQCPSSNLPDNSHIPRNEGLAKSINWERRRLNR